MASKTGKSGITKLPEVLEAGNPIAMPESAKAVWDELMRLGKEISRGWPEGIRSVDILSEVRW